MSSIQDYVNEVMAKLSGVAGSAFGEQSFARNTPNRFYAWRLLQDDFEAPSGFGKEGKLLKTRVASFVVRITGATLSEAEMLRAALVTAAGMTLGGHSNKSYRLGQAHWYSKADNTAAHVCDQEIAICVPFYEVVLPPGPAPQGAADSVFTTVEITARAIESEAFTDPTLGAMTSKPSSETSAPELLTVEELAERAGLNHPRKTFARALLFAMKGYAQGQMTTAEAFERDLQEALSTPIRLTPLFLSLA